MKPADLDWIQGLAQNVCTLDFKKVESYNQPVQSFLEEVCELVEQYIRYFNELVQGKKPEAACMCFRLSAPRHGLMVLRGKDKMVFSIEHGRLFLKVVSNHSFAEISVKQFDFDLQKTEMGTSQWFCLQDGQAISAEIVVRHYLSKFFVGGAKAYAPQEL